MVWGLKSDLIFSENVHKPLLYRKLLKVKFTLHSFHPLVLIFFPDTGERQIYHTASCTTCCFTQAADLFHWDPHFNCTSFFFSLFFKNQKSNSIVISLYTHSTVVFWILYLCSGCHISRVVTLRGKNSFYSILISLLTIGCCVFRSLSPSTHSRLSIQILCHFLQSHLI